MRLFNFLYPYQYPTPFSQMIEFFYFFIVVSLIVLTVINTIDVQKLKTDRVDSILYTSGSEGNLLLSSNPNNYTRVYRLSTSLYNFGSDRIYSGYFRIIFKNNPTNGNVKFRVLDSNSINITVDEEKQLTQNNMVANFKTVAYTPYLDLECKIAEANLLIESISIYAEGNYVSGLL